MNCSSQNWTLVYMLLSLVVATAFDIRCRRIPNVVTLSILLVSLIGYGFTAGLPGVLMSLKGFMLGFVLFFIPYIFGYMGAGDVKLMGAVGAVLGGANILVALLFVAVCGGTLSLCYMIFRGSVSRTLSRIWMAIMYLVTQRDTSLLRFEKKELTQEGMPFAVAISAGVFLYIIYVWSTTGMLPVLDPV